MTAEPLDLEPIKARLAAATPGRWVWLDHNLAPEDEVNMTDIYGNPHTWSGQYAISAEPLDDDEDWRPEGRDIVFVLDYIEDGDDDNLIYQIPINDADATLIVNAPDDIAALIAEVERLRAQLGGNT